MSSDSINPLLRQLDSAATQSTSTKKKANGAIGQDEFLQMLVAQLKNQDPLDPMSNEDFAVNLAQFSQLEKLVSIDQKLGDSSTGGISSYAGYLGNEVTLNSDKAVIENGEGGQAVFNLVGASQNVKLELVDASGAVAQRFDLGAMDAGKHRVDLSELDVPNGTYTLRAVAQTASGEMAKVPTFAAGVVTGFVPGAEPALLIGNREVAPADVTEVTAPRQ